VHVTAEARFAADPATVAAMLADLEFVHSKVAASGALSHTADVVGDDNGAFTVTTRRQMPADAIPAQFRSLVGTNLEVRQVEAWEAAGPDGRHGTMLVEVIGVPVRFTGTSHLRSEGTGSLVTVAGDLKAAIPLFGSAIEKATSEALFTAVSAEESAGRDWLTSR
jgi:hypothetical protein